MGLDLKAVFTARVEDWKWFRMGFPLGMEDKTKYQVDQGSSSSNSKPNRKATLSV
jgi:hypothetical protein